MAPGTLDEIWRRAQARWTDITSLDPSLEPAVALQRGLVRELMETAAELDRAGLVAAVPAATLNFDAKLARGLPALRGERVIIPGMLRDSVLRICDVLASGPAPESALHIQEALASGSIDTGSLLAASLSRHQAAIRTTAVHHGLSPDLMWLVGELGVAPLAHALQRSLAGLHGPSVDVVRRWDRGYCPFCGSWPAMTEVLDGARMLRCSFCASAWETPAGRCTYCGESGDDLIVASPDSERRNRRLELCRRCGGYTKVVNVDALTPFPLIAIEDLATADLDRGAMERGYNRPGLIDLDRIEPLAALGCE